MTPAIVLETGTSQKSGNPKVGVSTILVGDVILALIKGESRFYQKTNKIGPIS